MTAISRGFPGVMCHSVGLDETYESIVWDGGTPLPSKQTLDEWISANQNAPISNRHITVLAFRNRYTLQEKVAIELAAADNPSGTIEQRTFTATIRSFLKDMDNATYIDLDRADTRFGVNTLEQYGVIGVGRAVIILDGPITEIERSILTELQ